MSSSTKKDISGRDLENREEQNQVLNSETVEKALFWHIHKDFFKLYDHNWYSYESSYIWCCIVTVLF